MGSDSIDFSLSYLWQSWYKFKKGKKRTSEFEEFEYNLEKNLFILQKELYTKTYKHGKYRKFIAMDNKKREISVTSIKDRIVHRLAYEYLVGIFDKTFIYDVWSCRKNKGLVGAIERTQDLSHKYPGYWVWRSDIKKFFDSVDHKILYNSLFRKIFCLKDRWLLREIVSSYDLNCINSRETAPGGRGLPIGNLTSQIFANIYLNELDRFVVHQEKPTAYLRYGDDFVIFERDIVKLQKIRENIVKFMQENLKLNINQKNDIIIKVKDGLKLLGVQIFPKGRRLTRRNLLRISQKLDSTNVSSYYGLVKQHHKKNIKLFSWQVLEKINNE